MDPKADFKFTIKASVGGQTFTEEVEVDRENGMVVYRDDVNNKDGEVMQTEEESNMPAGWWLGSTHKAECSFATSSLYDCKNRGLTHIPQNLPTSLKKIYLKRNQIKIIQKGGILLIGTVILTIWCKRRTKNLPSDPSLSLNAKTLSKLNMTGTVVTNRHYQTGPGQSQAIIETNPNTIADLITPDHDHQYENMTQHNQTGQGQSQAITKSDTNTTAAVVASGHDHQYEDMTQHNHVEHGQCMANIIFNENNTAAVVSSGHDQQHQTGQDLSQAIIEAGNPSYGTGQIDSMQSPLYKAVGQSQAITESNPNTTATVMTSGHDHQYEDVDQHDQTGQDQSQAIMEARNPSYGTGKIDSMQSPLYKAVGQSQAITESNLDTTAALITSGLDYQYEDINKRHNQTGQSQSQVITEYNPNTTATVMTSGHDHQYEDIDQHDQTERGQSQAKAQPRKVENLSDDEVLAALKLNPMYAGVEAPPKNQTSTARTRGHNQIGQGQSQTINESNTNTTAAIVTCGHDQQYEDIDKQHYLTGKGQSLATTESNTSSTATVMSSCHNHKYEDMNQHNVLGHGQSQSIIQSLNFENLSHNEVLAALKPNPMYVGRRDKAIVICCYGNIDVERAVC
uniref:Uncharacterized protein n=1 Tax=Branchiostoma floridae TaxID=7739 RepID=C3Y781_BRAFL|eukprot:XP_002607699.1 hypothetical protein BRAFLDRAFT_82855 [Branchiostoma floridae]